MSFTILMESLTITSLKLKLMDEFGEFRQQLNLSGKQSTKNWIMCQDDLT